MIGSVDRVKSCTPAQAVELALDSFRLEGIETSQTMKDILKLYADGKITDKDVLQLRLAHE